MEKKLSVGTETTTKTTVRYNAGCINVISLDEQKIHLKTVENISKLLEIIH
jgi:hypothetical protein